MTNQTTSGIHNSATCTLGPNATPCDQCRAGNEYEGRQRVEAATNAGCNCPLHRLSPAERTERIDRAIEATTAEYGQVLSRATARAALFDTIDDYCKWGIWQTLNDLDEDKANEAREQFVEAFIGYVAALQAPPHRMDERLLAEVERLRNG